MAQVHQRHVAAGALAERLRLMWRVSSNLKEQLRRKRRLTRTLAGLVLRIAQRIVALTIGMLLNTISGRPARALADGR